MTRSSRLILAGLCLAPLACKGTNIVKVGEQTDTFIQKGQDQQTETFSQRPGAIDILFVLDNQPYMCAPSTKLAAEFQVFITQLNTFGLDFQIGVVASDMDNPMFQGKLVADSANDLFLTSSMTTTALVTNFGQMITRCGSNGSTNSQPLLAAATALQPPLSSGNNSGFLRPNAALAIIVVDDEDDYSLTVSPEYLGFDGGVPTGPTGANGDPVVLYFDRVFKSLEGPGNDALVSVSGIVGATPDTQPPVPASCTVATGSFPNCTYPYGGADPAYRILQVVADTGGLGQSLCETDFSTILMNLGQLLGGLTTSFAITTSSTTTQVFESSTLTVSVIVPGGDGGPQLVPENTANGWSYNTTSQTVQFNGTSVPPPGSTILISFATLNASFPLTYQPLTSTLQVTVTVNGHSTTVEPVAQDPTTGYTYDETTNSIVFPPSNLPPLNSTITVEYST